MKVLIADDERLVRLGIKTMLEELYPGMFEFFEACSGTELVGLSNQKPDVAFVDIKMPNLDGIEAIAQSKRNSPDTVWFLLTGFSEFEYAQKAIELGISEYILKPISPDKLSEVMGKALSSLWLKRVEMNQRLKTELMLSLGGIETNQAFSFGPDGHAGFAAFMFLLDGKPEAMIIALEAAFETGPWNCLHAYLFLQGSELCYIVHGPPAALNKAFGIVKDGVLTLGAKVVYDDEIPGFQGVAQACQRMEALSRLRTVLNLPPVIPVGELVRLSRQNELQAAAQQVESLCLAFLEKDKQAYKESIGALQALVWNNKLAGLHFQTLTAHLQAALGIQLYSKKLADLPRELAGNMDRIGQTRKQDIALQMKEYVRSHCGEDISITVFAELFGITPNYLSKLFHQSTGQKFSDYLTGERVAAAKRMLLNDRDITVREVAEAVGYFSPRHFSKVFYKITGQNPSDFQKGR